MHASRSVVGAVLAAVSVAACSVPGTAPSTTDAALTSSSISIPPPRPEQPPTVTVSLSTLPPGAAVCDAFATITETGALGDPVLREVSGVAVSRSYKHVLWMHNDSRAGPTVYAVDTDGTLLATWTLEGEGVAALDWEDIAAGPGPDAGREYLYVGDIGDNFSLRSEIAVYRFPEPGIVSDGTITDVEVFRLTYPEPGLNAEALAVDPVTGDLILVAKDREGPETVWRAPGNELRSGLTTRLEPVATLDIGKNIEITAVDVTATGDRIAMRGYHQVYLWPRISLDLAETLAAEPCRAASPDEVQGESLAFDPAAVTLYTVSEGVGAPIYRIDVER